MSVKIMIDSGSDINEQEAKELGILFVPIQVRIGNEEYLDGVDLLPNAFYERLEKLQDLPQTSLINEYRWTEEFEKATSDGSELIAITLSSGISGTYQAAVDASKKFNGKVHVVDSMTAAAGERLLGLYALRLKKENLNASEIFEKLELKKSNIRVYAVMDTLKYLKKGGRISATTAFFGEMLSIKPVIDVLNGKVNVINKVKGNKKGNAYLNSKVEEEGGIDFDMPYALLFSGNDKSNFEKYKQDCAYLFEGNVPKEYSLSCTIGAHIGPGCVGISFFKK